MKYWSPAREERNRQPAGNLFSYLRNKGVQIETTKAERPAKNSKSKKDVK